MSVSDDQSRRPLVLLGGAIAVVLGLVMTIAGGEILVNGWAVAKAEHYLGLFALGGVGELGFMFLTIHAVHVLLEEARRRPKSVCG